MKKVTALILAASRKGAEDAVAQLQNKSHKCLVEVDGTIMLERVVTALAGSEHVERIFVAIESEDILRQASGLTAMLDADQLHFVQSAGNLFASIQAAITEIESPYPLLISCLLYTSPSPRDQRGSRMPSSA